MGLGDLLRNDKHKLCMCCHSQWALTTAGYNKKDKTFVYYFLVMNKTIVWAIYNTILELKSNLKSNAHFWPPSLECALLLYQLNPQQK